MGAKISKELVTAMEKAYMRADGIGRVDEVLFEDQSVGNLLYDNQC